MLSRTPNLSMLSFLLLLTVLAAVAWLIARQVSRHVPEIAAGGPVRRKRYQWPTFGKMHGVKVHPTDYVPIRSARGNRKRDLTTMLALAGRPTSGRQRRALAKQLNRLAAAGGIA